jgi:hypothetical protein
MPAMPANAQLDVVHELPALGDVLHSRRWLRREDPFPHFVATDVFSPTFYRSLCEAFDHVFRHGFDDDRGADVWTGVRQYDAQGLQFPPWIEGSLSVFVSRPWHDMIAALAGVQATGHVNSGLHHHAVGSASGAVHNDFNPGWFAEYGGRNITVSREELCRYTTGEAANDVHVTETVRAVAVIFYLSNPPWAPGDGGETALYRTACDPATAPCAVVPPHGNSILVFECTPFSYHGFRTNVRSHRNSVIMWLHQSKQDAIARWGPRVVPWTSHDMSIRRP